MKEAGVFWHNHVWDGDKITNLLDLILFFEKTEYQKEMKVKISILYKLIYEIDKYNENHSIESRRYSH